MTEPFDLSSTFVHLGAGASAVPLPGFAWTTEYLRGYLLRFAREHDEQRLVGIVALEETWTHWECHVGGDELVVQLSGRSAIVQDVDGEHRAVPLEPGQAMVNPKGIWHTSDVYEPGRSLFVAAGRQTKYRPREPGEGLSRP
jgi:uncharacterized cupin superfamily protein